MFLFSKGRNAILHVMKIKPASKRHIMKSRLRAARKAGSLVVLDEKPKKLGRLASMNKMNRRRKKLYKSEFIIMAERIDAMNGGAE